MAMMTLRRPALEGAATIINTRWPACRAGRGACSEACRNGRRVEDYRAQVATLSLNFFYFLTPHTHHPPDLLRILQFRS